MAALRSCLPALLTVCMLGCAQAPAGIPAAGALTRELGAFSDSKLDPQVAQVLAEPFGAQFDRLDGDKDGKLTQAEYLAPAKDEATQRVKGAEYTDYLDPRHKGKVDKQTFLAGLQRAIVHKCGMQFNFLDGNRDGVLTAKEAHGVSATDFPAADTNHDGKLNQDEYLLPFARSEASFAQYYGV